MPLLVAAASDQTGRTITLLSAGLIAVALGLTALTIWYWRFTSPKRRALMLQSTVGVAPAAEVPTVAQSAVVEPSPSIDEVTATTDDERAPVASPPAAPTPVETPTGDGESIGLDDEQWAVLTQAVMDEYLDS